MKISIYLFLAIMLGACANPAMHEPLSAASEQELQDSLGTLKLQISARQFERTQSAIGILLVTNLDIPERQRVLQQLIDGQSPNELIAAARLPAARFRIK